MNIDINGLNSSQTSAGKAKPGQNTKADNPSSGSSKGASTPSKETVSISAEARALSQLDETSKGSAFNEAKVAEIRSAIDNGTYKPNPQSIAQGILNSDDLF